MEGRLYPRGVIATVCNLLQILCSAVVVSWLGGGGDNYVAPLQLKKKRPNPKKGRPIVSAVSRVAYPVWPNNGTCEMLRLQIGRWCHHVYLGLLHGHVGRGSAGVGVG